MVDKVTEVDTLATVPIPASAAAGEAELRAFKRATNSEFLLTSVPEALAPVTSSATVFVESMVVVEAEKVRINEFAPS